MALALVVVLLVAVWASVYEGERAMVEQAKRFHAGEAAEEAHRAESGLTAVREFVSAAATAASTPGLQFRIEHGERDDLLKALVDVAPARSITRVAVTYDSGLAPFAYPDDVDIVVPTKAVRRAPDGTDAWFVLSEPIRNSAGDTYARLHAEVSLARLLTGITTNVHGRSGAVSLVERDGTVLLTGSDERRGRALMSDTMQALLRSGRPGMARYYSPLTKSEQIAALKPVGKSPWTILVSAEAAVALRQADELSVRIAVILVVALGATVLLICAAAWLTSHTGRKLAAERGAAVQLAATDPLTGLGNRRAFQAALDAITEGQTAGVVAIDLDRFKDINDQCGHETGDLALQLVAHAVRQATRPQDVVARLGGDEFAIVVADADPDLVVSHLVTRLRDTLRGIAVQGYGQLSGSIGTAIAHPHEHGADVLRRADADMYEDKRRRYNQPSGLLEIRAIDNDSGHVPRP